MTIHQVLFYFLKHILYEQLFNCGFCGYNGFCFIKNAVRDKVNFHKDRSGHQICMEDAVSTGLGPLISFYNELL